MALEATDYAANGLVIAAGTALFLIASEALFPARPAQRSRWPLNLALGALTLIIGRMFAIIAPLSAAIWAQSQGIGLFNLIGGFDVSKVILTVVLMDLSIYWQHRAFHRFGWMWRWHKLHHADKAMDISTGVRFHPGEVLISLFWKSACVIALGAPPEAVVIFELWLMLGSFIEHSNVRLPLKVDRAVRTVWVTPAMHAVHHSAHGDDAQHNFGFAIGLWDRLFGTNRATAAGSVIGLPGPLPQSPAL
jgi:sterol desaturase/sphingolipid hydroxylase (fatty acid hydroxylase superfamily)